MRLKVSPKEALTVIDRLLIEGYDLLESCMPGMVQGEDKKLMEWLSKTVDYLYALFLDFSPIYTFLKASRKISGHGFHFGISLNEKDEPWKVHMIEALDVLHSFYQNLAEQLYTPLFYIPDKAQICFFASVCPLQPDSNEDALCRYMFSQHSYHEWVEMEDVFVHAFGGSADEYNKQDKAKIDNAHDGVNRKSNEAFGFPLFKKKKALLCLNLPSRFLREDNKIIAS